MLSGKVMIIHLITDQITKIFLQKMSYFREPYIVIVGKKKQNFNFSNYATKSDLKGIKAIDRSEFATKLIQLT